MKAFRIAGAGHPVFNGGGAELIGGRWNAPGRRVIYAGTSFAIAVLERLVYAAIGRTPTGDRFIEIDIPDDAVETLDPAALPGWDYAGRAVSTGYGDRWYDEHRSAVLMIPSAVSKIDRNVAINERHADFARITASAEQPVVWDARLFLRRPNAL